ncbi:MAG: hypothetical protein QNJ44_08845 [Rhodobacter sp.]|nr:hypothetical protein [Rhodobacter sp.]
MAGEEVYIARFGAWAARALAIATDLYDGLDTDDLGFAIPEAVAADGAVVAAGRAIDDAAEQLEGAAADLETAVTGGNEAEVASTLLALVAALILFVDALKSFVVQLRTLSGTLAGAERAAYDAFIETLPGRTIEHVAATVLSNELPRLGFLLRLLGLMEVTVVPEDPATGRPSHVRRSLHLGRIKDLVSDPAAHFTTVYGWGTDGFDPYPIFDAVTGFYRGQTAIEAGRIGNDAFLKYRPWRLERDSTAMPPGLLLDISADASLEASERVPIDANWGTAFDAELKLAGGVRVRLRPPFDLTLEPKTGTASGAASVTVDRNPDSAPVTIIGGNDLVGLTAKNIGISAELTVGASTSGAVSIDPGILAQLEGLTLSLGSENSDSFLASLLADADIEGQFDLGLGWTLSGGLTVRAAGGLEIAIPMHQDLGVARFETLYLILKIRDDGSFGLETSASITGTLGPLSASVERIGVEVRLAFSDSGDATFGPLELSLAFKPPNGVGLALDAGVVKGGGYLYLDYEKGEYAGALELVFSGFLEVKAIGLITTRMPDGSDGFSLLIIITAEFGTPIQLGFGFTLIGVGGLLGLNRTMRLEDLAEGVRTGAIQSIMFPNDVVANAPRIISDMRRFFPPEQGTFLIGPMAKIGWGTPTLISASLGVIVEVPPGNIAILGVLKCALPDEDTPLLLLQIKFIGALEVDKSRLWFFASLYESRVLFITLDGEMGLLIAWGSQSNFVLSVGGFHPRFTAPALPFPQPRRIAISILNESFARIRVEGYFAVTSNTAQFGARVEIFFGVDAFSIDGHIGFDALFQFSPFYFIITFSASVSVKVFGAGLFSVRIRGELEGTSPWHVEGEGSISILFWDIDVPFSHTWGDSADTVLPEIAALPILKAELEKDANWQALPPPGASLSVSLRAIEPEAELVLHPVGALRITQRALPLELSIEKVGNQSVSDVTRLALDFSAAGLTETGKVREPFATAQFRDLNADARLSAPGYEDQVAGSDISVDGSDTRTSHAVKRTVFHELITIDSNYKEHIQLFFVVLIDWFAQMLGSNATARSLKAQAVRRRLDPFDEKIATRPPGFVVAGLADNVALDGGVFVTQSDAQDALKVALAKEPSAGLHVIPEAEARMAA